MPSTTPGFEIVCEIEPATKPDLMPVRHEIGVLSAIASAFLIPDNHLGRATVSSVACAHEVEAMGGRSVACVNSRDRNLLGFRRDLLTAAAYQVREFLLVHGDRPSAGERSSDLTVRQMVEEVRTFGTSEAFEGSPAFRVGVTARAGADLVPWKQGADFLFTQVGFAAEQVTSWRSGVAFDGPVYAGVMVLASADMARRLRSTASDLDIPDRVIEGLERDRNYGVDLACDLVAALADGGFVDGVHLVPVRRYREVAARLEADGFGRRGHRRRQA